MKKDELEELIQNGENSRVEFKEIRGELDTDDLAMEMVALVNSQGGKILLGVSDEGEIKGEIPAKLEATVMNIARDKIEPPIIPAYEEIEISGKRIAVIEIISGQEKPYFFLKRGRKIPYLRVGSTKREASREELRRLYQAASLLHYDTLPVPQSLPEDLNWLKLEEYFKRFHYLSFQQRGKAEQLNLLKNKGFLAEWGEKTVCSVAGLLLFGKKPDHYLPQCGINFAHFKGDSIGEILYKKELSATIIENIDAVGEIIKARAGTAHKISGMKLEEQSLYPKAAIREAVVNALIHRDYTISGAQVRIFLFADRLEIKSPGRLPNTVTVEKMKVSVSVFRNPLLAQVLQDYEYMQKLGSGIPIIIESILEASGKEPLILEEGEEVTITLFPRR